MHQHGIDLASGLSTGSPSLAIGAQIVRFEEQAVKSETVALADDGSKAPVTQTVIRIVSPGNDAVVRRATEIDKVRYKDIWDAYQNGDQADTISGTPLADLPGISAQQIGALNANSVFSLEQLAASSDQLFESIRDGRELVSRARLKLDETEGASEQIALAKNNAALMAQMEAMQKQLDTIKAEKSAAPAKRAASTKTKGKAEKVEDDGPSLDELSGDLAGE